MPARQLWRQERFLAVMAQALAVGVPLAVAVTGALVARGLFAGVPAWERLAWAPVVALVLAPVVLAIERLVAFLLELADLLALRLEFADGAPSRLRAALTLSSVRTVEAETERLRRRTVPSPRNARSLVVSVLGLERYHPGMRARLVPAQGCAHALAEALSLEDDEQRLVGWLLELRLAADVLQPPDLDAWLAAAHRAVPGAPRSPAQTARVGAAAGVAAEFGVLVAPRPYGASLAGLDVRPMLVDAAEGVAHGELAEALRRIPDATWGRLAPEPAALTPARAWRPAVVRLAPALALVAGVLVGGAVLSGLGRDGDQEPGPPEVAGIVERNHDPEASADTVTVSVGATVTVAVLENDADADGDRLVLERFEAARLGTLERTGDRLRYTAKTVGTERILYVAADGHGGEDSALLVVTVEP